MTAPQEEGPVSAAETDAAASMPQAEPTAFALPTAARGGRRNGTALPGGFAPVIFAAGEGEACGPDGC